MSMLPAWTAEPGDPLWLSGVAWRHLWAMNDFGLAISTGLRTGLITRARYEGAIAGLVETGQRIDTITERHLTAYYSTPEPVESESVTLAHFPDGTLALRRGRKYGG